MLHHNTPTLFYFYELLQNTKEEFALRDKYKRIQEEHQSETSITDEFVDYSNEGLLNYESRLYQDLQSTPVETELYKELNKVHQAIEKEISNRGLDDVF